MAISGWTLARPFSEKYALQLDYCVFLFTSSLRGKIRQAQEWRQSTTDQLPFLSIAALLQSPFLCVTQVSQVSQEGHHLARDWPEPKHRVVEIFIADPFAEATELLDIRRFVGKLGRHWLRLALPHCCYYVK